MKRSAKIKILCTLGPSSHSEYVINRLTDVGADLFRINLSHTSLEELPGVIELIKSFTNVPICLDTEGAQIRTGNLENDLYVKENKSLVIKRDVTLGGPDGFNLYPLSIFEKLIVGDLITIDFNSVMVQVVEKTNAIATLRVLMGGLIQQNKAVTLSRNIALEPLTKKDKESLKIGLQYGLTNFALSFANTASDVKELRSIVGDNKTIISKIESISGINNLDEICEASDAILIDRGDLSREISIENIPAAQKHIIGVGKENDTSVFVATNLLESMINSITPTRAEVNDIHNTLCDGADGLVLAAETAIGKHPIQCVTMIRKMIVQFERSSNHNQTGIEGIANRESLILPRPHGGKLVNQLVDSSEEINIDEYKKINVELTTIMDAEQIAIGTLSPLTGFMNKAEINSVLSNYQLASGLTWPIPIFCQVNESQYSEIEKGQVIILTEIESGEAFVRMNIDDKFKLDLSKMSKQLFGTDNLEHPGVARLFKNGKYFISGKVELLKRFPAKYKHYEITPAEARKIFENKGWSRIVGFHTRNIPHRVQEYIQSAALKEYHCDGVFLHPVVGPQKAGDYVPEMLLESYQLLIRNNYLEGKVFLGAFQNYSRYAGPREAVFTAICRKNYGCSHFILGRDHTGVGDYYLGVDLKLLFSQLGEIGIEPIIFDEVVYSEEKSSYIRIVDAKKEKRKSISGTKARAMLKNGKLPPSWFMREEVSRYIIDAIKNDQKCFVE